MELLKKDSYILYRSDNRNGDKFTYSISHLDLPGVIIRRWPSREEWNKNDVSDRFPEFAQSEVYKTFEKFITNDTRKKSKDQPKYTKQPDYMQTSLFDDDYDYDEEENWRKKPTRHQDHSKDSNAGYIYPSSIYNFASTRTYALDKEAAIEKYCKSNTLCLHKSDPTTTMLRQIYEGKGWDVINDAHEFSSDTLNELIDRHERIVMLGHGTPYGLMGFISPEQAPHLEPKKLFALWCNADAYCNTYLPNKKGFFACGNMPSDDGEASCVGFRVSHKYMDDNITYWCKLCGDVVEQCLEGDADAGCQYIREKYWEKYHEGSANEIGITKYNYVRTKVAGQANLPEPTGEKITHEDPPAPTYKSYGGYYDDYDDYDDFYSSRYSYPVARTSTKKDDKTTTTGFNYPKVNLKSPEICLCETTKGFEIFTREDWASTPFIYIRITDKTSHLSRYQTVVNLGYKTVQEVFDALKKQITNYDLGDLIVDAKVTTKEELIQKHTPTLIKEGLMNEGEEWPADIDPEIFDYVEFVDESMNEEYIEESADIPEAYAVDLEDIEVDRYEAVVKYCVSRKDTGYVLGYVQVDASYDMKDDVWTEYTHNPETYDSPAEDDIEITSDLEELFNWNVTYLNASKEEEEISEFDFINRFGVNGQDALKSIVNYVVTNAKKEAAEKAEDYIYDNYFDIYDDDYDPSDDYEYDED